jgi:hypothetical protein
MTASKLKLISSIDKKLSLSNYRRTSSITAKIANGRHIAAGAFITSQLTANSLPSVNSVVRRRQAKADRKKLFNGNYLYIVGDQSNNIVAENCMAA